MIVNENNYVHLSNGVKILTIEQLHKLYPKLTPGGFNYKSNGKWVYDLDDDRIIKRPIEYKTVAEFLTNNIAKIKTINKSGSTYHFKHVVEDNIHHYVANGILIAAALACDYKMKYYSGPNALFAWSEKDWNRFQNVRGNSGPPLDSEWTKEKSENLRKLFDPTKPRKSPEWMWK
jgi:hypothetical protein